MNLILILVCLIISGCAPSINEPADPVDADLPDPYGYLDPQFHVMPENAELILTAEPVSSLSSTNNLFRFRDVKVLKGVLDPALVDEDGFLALELSIAEDTKAPSNTVAIYAKPRQNQDPDGGLSFRNRYAYSLYWQGLISDRAPNER